MIAGSLTYTRADEADIEGIQHVAAKTWRATYKGIFSEEFIASFLGRAYSTEALQRSIRNPQALFLVAKDADRVVGYCHFGPGERGPELYRMYVLPDYWRAGIGTRFVHMMEAHWREQGVSEYSCVVHARNEIGKAFYLKHGFVHEPARDQADEWCMVRRIGR